MACIQNIEAIFYSSDTRPISHSFTCMEISRGKFYSASKSFALVWNIPTKFWRNPHILKNTHQISQRSHAHHQQFHINFSTGEASGQRDFPTKKTKFENGFTGEWWTLESSFHNLNGFLKNYHNPLNFQTKQLNSISERYLVYQNVLSYKTTLYWIFFPTCRLWSKAGKLSVTRNFNSCEVVFTQAESHLYYVHGSSKVNMNFRQFKKATLYLTADKATGGYKSVERLKFN